MKIGILSDSHDHVWNLRKAVKQATDLGVEEIIHCGDLISPFMLEEFEPFTGRVHLIYGNNPGDHILLARKITAMDGKVVFYGWVGELEYGDLEVCFIHDPDLARKIARSGDFGLVCFGHTHRWHLERIRDCIFLNPGEILGKKEPAGWALLDTDSLEIEHIFLDT